MGDLGASIDEIATSTGFSGVVSIDRAGDVEFAAAYGLAHRAFEIENTLETKFAIGSGTKGLTALAVMGLVEAGSLELATTARSVLRDDLPLIGPDVTVGHLLAHTSGIGDYYDEESGIHAELTDYVLPVGVHELATTEQFLGPCSTAFRRSSRPASGSRTATAGSSCSR